MGGYGSGRRAQRITCESGLKIDLADPAIRKALTPQGNTGGSWAWSSHGREIAAIRYGWSSAEARLTLRYNCTDAPVAQTLTLTRTTPNFGGERMWFVCPFTGKRVRALYLPPGEREWGSRHAYKLTYQSQRESGQGRAIMGLLTRCGRWPGDPVLARATLLERDPLGLCEERRWKQRCEAHKRRNEMRRIARQQRRA